MDKPDAFFELRFLVLLGGVESTLEIVEHRQQLLHQPLGGARSELELLARRALAVVVELRHEALERVEVLVPLARHVRERVERYLELLLFLFGEARLVGHGFAAPFSSSITTFSATSTISI